MQSEVPIDYTLIEVRISTRVHDRHHGSRHLPFKFSCRIIDMVTMVTGGLAQ